MDAVSYPNPKVIDFFDKNLVAVKVLINSQPLPKKFRVQWTPTLVLLDADGEEHNRTVGFLPPEELLPSLMLGIGKSQFDHDDLPLPRAHSSTSCRSIRRAILVRRLLTIRVLVATSARTTPRS